MSGPEDPVAPQDAEPIATRGRPAAYQVLIVEDEMMVADLLRSMIEGDPRFAAAVIAWDTQSALRSTETCHFDLAFVDIELAAGSSGYAVAAELRSQGTSCFFVTANPPPFLMPEFALGCIVKPWSLNDIVDALKLFVTTCRGSTMQPPTPDSKLQRY